MGSISKIASKCRSCQNKDICGKKQMEACTFIKTPNLEENAKCISQPNARDTANINISGIHVNQEDIAKEISKVLSTNFAFCKR